MNLALEYVRNVRNYFVNTYWRWRNGNAQPLVSDDAGPTASSETKKVRHLVDLNFRSGILDRLDECFACMERLRWHDPDAYRSFRHVGFSVSNYVANPDMDRAQYQGVVQPSFGGILMAQPGKDDQNVYASFIYFRKLRCPANVELTTRSVYEVTVLYLDRKKCRETWTFNKKVAGVCVYYMELLPDWSTRLLKERRTTSNTIHPTRNGKRQPPLNISTTSWRLPEWIREAASQHGRTPEQWADEIFRMSLYTHIQGLQRFIVRAEHGHLAASFGIALKRAPYFFKDRDDTILTPNGTRRKIFHSVIEHPRRLANGRMTTVKAHYRGLRVFQWKDYAITIVTAKNAETFQSFDVPGVMVDDHELMPEATVPFHYVARKLKDMLVGTAAR